MSEERPHIHRPKVETFDIAARTNVDPKGFVRPVEHYREEPWGLYMARHADHPRFHYLESWIIPRTRNSGVDPALHPGTHPRLGFLCRHRRLHPRRPGLDVRGPLPRPDRADRTQRRIARRRRIARGEHRRDSRPEDVRACDAERGPRYRRHRRPRSRSRRLAHLGGHAGHVALSG